MTTKVKQNQTQKVRMKNVTENKNEEYIKMHNMYMQIWMRTQTYRRAQWKIFKVQIGIWYILISLLELVNCFFQWHFSYHDVVLSTNTRILHTFILSHSNHIKVPTS